MGLFLATFALCDAFLDQSSGAQSRQAEYRATEAAQSLHGTLRAVSALCVVVRFGVCSFELVRFGVRVVLADNVDSRPSTCTKHMDVANHENADGLVQASSSTEIIFAGALQLSSARPDIEDSVPALHDISARAAAPGSSMSCQSAATCIPAVAPAEERDRLVTVNNDLFDREVAGDDGIRFARTKLKVRTGADLHSSVACDDVPAGIAVLVRGRRELVDGTKRALISLVRLGASSSPIGWVSEVNKDGQDNLLLSSPFRRRGRTAEERTAKPAIALAQSAASTHGIPIPRPYWEHAQPTEPATGLVEPLTAPVCGASVEHLASLNYTVTQQERLYRQLLVRGIEQPTPSHPLHTRTPEQTGCTPRLKTPLPKEATLGARWERRPSNLARTIPSNSEDARVSQSERPSSAPPRPYWERSPERSDIKSSTLQIGGVVTLGPFGMPPASEFNEWTATS